MNSKNNMSSLHKFIPLVQQASIHAYFIINKRKEERREEIDK